MRANQNLSKTSSEIIAYIKINENKNKTCQNLWETAERLKRAQFIVESPILKKDLNINTLNRPQENKKRIMSTIQNQKKIILKIEQKQMKLRIEKQQKILTK